MLIHDAAASALGRMLNRFAQNQDITVINIVRRQEQVDILKELGATYILNSSDETFLPELQEIIDELKPKIYFSAIGGGDLPTKVLNMMPSQSTLYVYGALCTDITG